MIPIKVPDWFDSIRAIIALCLVFAFCIGAHRGIALERLELIKELTLYALIFYFTLKKRPKENGGGQ